MTTETTYDLDVPGQAGDVLRTMNRLRDHFKATYVDIGGADYDTITFRLRFRGFKSVGAAFDRVSEVAARLDSLAESPSVHAGVTNDGMADRAADEHDGRPAGWVNVTFNKRFRKVHHAEGD